MMKFKHIIITQFNLKNIGVGSTLNPTEWIEWNEYRFQFFEKYTLPSLLNQSVDNYTWVLFFDKDTPASCKHYITKWEKESNIEVAFYDGVDDFNENYTKLILELSKDYEWIITSRIDNDDAFHYKSIEAIQNNFIERDKVLIYLASGYVFDIKTKLLSHYYYFKSPFMSIIEKNDKNNFLGVYRYIHTKWPNSKFSIYKMILRKLGLKSKGTTIFLVDYPYWVQYIHNNLQNTFYRGVPVLGARNMKDYSSDSISRKGSVFSIFKYYNYYLWKTYLQGVIYKIIKPLYHL